jgi:hypothetical protein
LTDVGHGAMVQFEGFIDCAEQAGARFSRDFPPDCVPVRRGELPIDNPGLQSAMPI